MAEPQAQQGKKPSGKASLKNGKQKCPLAAAVTVVLRSKDMAVVDATINVKLVNRKGGGYTQTCVKGVASFDNVAAGNYEAHLSIADDVEYIADGPIPAFAVAENAVKSIDVGIRKKPWIGWKVLNLADNKTVANAVFKVVLPDPKDQTGTGVWKDLRPSGDHDIARADKLKGDKVELQEVRTDAVLVFDSLESA